MRRQEPVRVLIVEDNPRVREMIQRLLENMGYVVAGQAVNGQQAVEMTQSLRPDVVLKVGAGAYLVKPPNAEEMDRAITIAITRFDDMMQLRRLNAELTAKNQEAATRHGSYR